MLAVVFSKEMVSALHYSQPIWKQPYVTSHKSQSQVYPLMTWSMQMTSASYIGHPGHFRIRYNKLKNTFDFPDAAFLC